MYQPQSGPPPIGLNPVMNPNYPNPEGSGYPPGYPPNAGGYPPAGYPPNSGGYPPGYPPESGYQPGYQPEQPPMYPPPMEGGYAPPGGVTTMQPVAGQGYPQPGQEDWMPRPMGPICPPGLEYLTMIDHLMVKQKVELLEAFLGFETKNKYTIKNNAGQKIYTAKEDTDCCTRNCCGPNRAFNIMIKDNSGMEVIHLSRDLACDSCFFPCCLQKLRVMAPPGTVVGYVTQKWSIFAPEFTVENASGDCILRIKGPICTFSICGDVEFQVLSKDGQVEVGRISKQWAGFLKETFTDTDNFGISFPMDLDVNMKAVLLGAMFLIDFMFFEKSGNKENDTPGMF